MSKGNSEVRVTLGAELAEALDAYMVAANLATRAEAVRQILWTSLATTPIEGRVIDAGNRVYFQIRAAILQQLKPFFTHLAAEVERAIHETNQELRRADGS